MIISCLKFVHILGVAILNDAKSNLSFLANIIVSLIDFCVSQGNHIIKVPHVLILYLLHNSIALIIESCFVFLLYFFNNSSFEDWFESTKKHFIDFNTSSNSAIKDLEKIYEEKLRLQKPAEYWNLRASTLRKEGYNWLKCLIISVIVGIITLVWVINRISTEKFETIFANTSIAVKWSLAIISLISFIAYIIRIFSKLTFSSFHLVRDAEEREQLTYFYLALQKEKNIDQTERHLIMQSLFSRVDSGLLKEDSSPTMPGNIVDQITKK